MSLLTLVVVLSVFMGVVAFVAGLVLCVQLGRRPSGTAATRRNTLGAVLLVGLGGTVVGTTMVTAALVTDREADHIRLRGAVNLLEAKIRVYEGGLSRLERALEAAREMKGEDPFAGVRDELAKVRQKRAGLP